MDQPLVLHALTICRRETDAMILCLGRRRQPPNRTIRVIQMSFFAASARWKNCVFWILSCQRQRVHNDQQQSDPQRLNESSILCCVDIIVGKTGGKTTADRRAGFWRKEDDVLPWSHHALLVRLHSFPSDKVSFSVIFALEFVVRQQRPH